MKKFRSYCSLVLISVFALLCVPAFSAPSDGMPYGLTDDLIDNLESSAVPASWLPKLESIEEILWAFSHGLSPDLNDSEQKQAFAIYRTMKFGDPLVHLDFGVMDNLARTFYQYPNLNKSIFRNYEIRAHKTSTLSSLPVTAELRLFSKTYSKKLAEVMRDLYQMETNPKAWKKILHYSEPVNQASNQPPNRKDKTAKQKALADWEAYFEKKIPATFRAKMADTTIPFKERATRLFELLKAERDILTLQSRGQSRGQTLSAISRALVDVIHSFPHQDPALQLDLSSEDGVQVMQALRRALAIRETFAIELGFKEGFEEVTQTYGFTPTGIVSNSLHLKNLTALQQGLAEARRQTPKEEKSSTLIRHLSIEESPLRSCLGKDCSSNTYLLKALDPNFHYFTLTDSKGASSGHVTIVLGDAYSKGTDEREGPVVDVAFIDKIQNIPHSELAVMLEGIRRSVLEKGYILALPDDLGNHNGLSNEDTTRDYVETHIRVEPNPNLQLLRFRPHWNSYDFDRGYSRAYHALTCSPLAPLRTLKANSKEVQLVPGELNLRWKTDKIDLAALIQGAIDLKNSVNLADRLRYIPTMEGFLRAKIPGDPEFQSVLQSWLEDSQQPFQLRKQVLIKMAFEAPQQPLLELLNFFSFNEQVQVMTNLLDTPRFRAIMARASDRTFLSWAIHFRAKAKLRTALLGGRINATLAGQLFPLYHAILGTSEISDRAATQLLSELIASDFDVNNVNDVFYMLYKSNTTKGATPLEEPLFLTFSTHVSGERSLGRALTKGLTSKDEWESTWAKQLLERDTDLSQYSILDTFKEILQYDSTHPVDPTHQEGRPEGFNFMRAAQSWLKDEDTDIQRKTDFLLSTLGIKTNRYENFRDSIPSHQWTAIQTRLAQTTSLLTFQKMLPNKNEDKNGDKNEPSWFFQDVNSESFEFVPINFPKEGKRFFTGSPETEMGRTPDEILRSVTLNHSFEIQKTPVTRRQWSIVMGGLPTCTYTNQFGTEFVEYGEHPIVDISMIDVNKFIKKLNKAQNDYDYRLPTEVEWEYAARAGTQTAFAFGDDPVDLVHYGWHFENSGGRRHPVAGLKANPFGLFDTFGNIFELTQTTYIQDDAMTSKSAVKGCSFKDSANSCRSAASQLVYPFERSYKVGFRLVRAPRVRAASETRIDLY